MAYWSPDKPHSDPKRWICLYPAYMNSKKTLAQGRRVPKDKAVENPTYVEIKDVLTAAGMKVEVENKQYSRERSKEMPHLGRIRVQLKHDDGTPLNPELGTRDDLMLHVCSMIPKLKTRQGKTGGEQHQSAAGSKSKKSKGRR